MKWRACSHMNLVRSDHHWFFLFFPLQLTQNNLGSISAWLEPPLLLQCGWVDYTKKILGDLIIYGRLFQFNNKLSTWLPSHRISVTHSANRKWHGWQGSPRGRAGEGEMSHRRLSKAFSLTFNEIPRFQMKRSPICLSSPYYWWRQLWLWRVCI